MVNKSITYWQVESPPMVIICLSIISETFWHSCLDEALQGDKKRFDWQATTGQRASKCGTARNSRVYNEPLLALDMWAWSYQVEHCQDNDDRSSDGGQREANAWPLYHRLRHSWQPLAPRQLLWKQALQRWKRSKEKDEKKMKSNGYEEHVAHPSPEIMCERVLAGYFQ